MFTIIDWNHSHWIYIYYKFLHSISQLTTKTFYTLMKLWGLNSVYLLKYNSFLELETSLPQLKKITLDRREKIPNLLHDNKTSLSLELLKFTFSPISFFLYFGNILQYTPYNDIKQGIKKIHGRLTLLFHCEITEI